jgi:hypothetical protein
MEADADFGANGALRRIGLRAARGNLSLVPAADGTARVSFSLREVSPPFGPPLLFQELAGEGLLKAGAFETTKLEGQIAGGALTGAARLSWSDGIAIDADFDLKNADTAEMLGMVARGFSATGSLALSGRLNLKAPTLDGLADTARLEARFSAQKGEVNNVDLMRAIQSPSARGQRGGRTAFVELSGELMGSGGRLAYRNLRLTSGALTAAGTLDVLPSSDIAGRVGVEIGSRTTVVARGTLTVSGSVKDPVLR